MARKKGGGGKLNRSEVIQARFDPMTHMAAEIMARCERRTLSSFIEHTIEQAAKTYKVKRNLFFPWWSSDPDLFCGDKIYSKYDIVTIERAMQDTKDDHEALRFFKFAMYFPDLLNNQEKEMFNKITFTPYFWMHYPVNVEDSNGNIIKKRWVQVDAIEGLYHPNLFEYWERIRLDQINIESLSELPIGKKISAPLKEDIRAIKKYIKTGNPEDAIKIIFAWNTSVELDQKESFWVKNSKKLVTKKIEIKETENGHEIVTTLIPPANKGEQKAWLEFYKKKMEEMADVD